MAEEAQSVFFCHKSSSLFRRSIVERFSTLEYSGERQEILAGVCRGESRAARAETYQWLPLHGGGGPLLASCGQCGAVMGNLYQYAMRKFSLSGCQTYHGQSSGSTCGALA